MQFLIGFLLDLSFCFSWGKRYVLEMVMMNEENVIRAPIYVCLKETKGVRLHMRFVSCLALPESGEGK